VALTLAGHAARAYASQGQARALVIALKIAEMENLRAALGRYPILLLDDVSSELDAERNTYLMAYLSALESQVLLTTTDADLVRGGAGKEALFFAVSEGGVSGAPGAIETQAITSG
jgi:DNA replication and repair protein RecF